VPAQGELFLGRESLVASRWSLVVRGELEIAALLGVDQVGDSSLVVSRVVAGDKRVEVPPRRGLWESKT